MFIQISPPPVIVCPVGTEQVKVGNIVFCQPTTPVTFEMKSRDEFPENTCPGRNCPDNARPKEKEV